MKMKITATAAFGLEAVVGRELRTLGIDNQVGTGTVQFEGDETSLAKANIWLRCADRVLVEQGSFTALTFEELFEGVKALPWEDWLGKDACFPVEGWCVQSQLMSVSDCQSIVKKAIVERLKTRYRLQWFEETGPTYRIRFGLLRNQATLYIDASGHGLHKRGYRPLNVAAPLHETLGAGLVYLSRWRTDQPLWDPCCGSGTIAIEAALLAAHKAPGINAQFEAEGWRQSDKTIWRQTRESARESERTIEEPIIFASDIDESAIALTRRHAQNAGVDKMLHIQRMDLKEIQTARPRGAMIANPPYGVRLGDRAAAEKLYRDMALMWKRLPGWSIHVISAHPTFERFFAGRAQKRIKLYNGGMMCQLYSYWPKT